MAVIPVSRGESASPPPNPEFLKRDPMAEVFGPGSGCKLVGDPDDAIPDEIRGVLDEFGLSKKSFQCTLKEVPEGSSLGDGESSSLNTKYIKAWTRSVPSVEYIAKTYGPGMYILAFSWRSVESDDDGEKKSKSMRQEIPLEISPKFADEYKKHRLNARIEEASEMSSTVRDKLIEKKLEGQIIKSLTGESQDAVNPAQAGKAYVEEVLNTAKMLGLSNMQPALPAPKSIEWDKILPAVMPVVTAFLAMQQQAEQRRSDDFNKMLMLMMSQSQNASGQLIEMMKAQLSGAGSAKSATQEYLDMIKGVVDIKEVMSGYGKESLSDKIFRVVEGVAPQILSIAATAAQAQAAKNTIPVKMAKGYIEGDPDFQALKQNPMEMKAFIDKMDSFFGWRQTDVVLAVAEWPRPDNCPRDPVREHPPVAAGGAEEAEVVE